jgi:tripartite-type tricarboxylate transporter receptor subunit TctC
VAIEPRTSTPDEMKAFLASEIVKWARVVKDAGIQPQ